MLPLSLALLLCGALALQLALGNQVELPVAGAVRAGERRGGVLADRPPLVRADPALATGAIFTPILTPPPGAGTATGAAATPLGGYVVAGVVQIGRGIFAIVQRPDGGVVRAGPGARIGGWRIEHLGRDEVRLARAGERLRIQLSPSGPVVATGKGE